MTVASLLKGAGYRTGVVGKWHLGLGPASGPDWNGEIKPGPLELGFDSAFIIPATGDRVPTVFVKDHRVDGLDPSDPIQVNYKQPIGSEPTGRDHPELLKLKHTHGHDMTIIGGIGRIGWMAGGRAARWTDEDISDTLVKQAVQFIEQNRERPFFLYLATHEVHVPRVPHPRFRGKSAGGTRGDVIEELDDAVGAVLATLDKLRLADDTLVIFTSDNGGVMDDGYEDVGRFDYQPNAPLRGTKGTLFEGGHRVPFIARWPGKIEAGTTSSALVAHLDMAATFAALVGADIPAGECADSVNVLPALLGNSSIGRPEFVAHIGGTQGPFAVRLGPWKLISARAGNYGRAAQGKAAQKPQLFDLEHDLAEEHDLAADLPDKVGELLTLLGKIRGEP